MAKDDKSKGEAKPAKAAKPEKPAKEKKAKPAAEAAPAAVAEAKPAKPPEAPRPPADPRLKVLKKFRGKYLPRGPLRDRLHAIITRWNGSEDRGGVTVDELKALFADWKSVREKKSKTTAKA